MKKINKKIITFLFLIILLSVVVSGTIFYRPTLSEAIELKESKLVERERVINRLTRSVTITENDCRITDNLNVDCWIKFTIGNNRRQFKMSHDVNDNRSPDIIIVCTGAESAARQAIECAGPGSRIIFFAVPAPGVQIEVPINDYWRNEVTIMTSYGAAPMDLDMAYNWLLAKRINVRELISHRFYFSQAQEAFNVVCEADKSLKVVLEPDQ